MCNDLDELPELPDGELAEWVQDPDVWTTKAGQQVKITDLTDTHLVNIIKFLRRAAAARQVAVVNIGEDLCVQWAALQAEAKKRGLKTRGK